jgi:flagellin FlaB
MEKRYMQRLVGKYCKIVTKEPGEERATVITGILEDVDYKDGFILVDSNQGLGCLRISTIIAIKPGTKRRPEKIKLKEEDEAIVGIGTLIVFIAMILVAAVAASVIIQTSESLQQRAYAVGKQTTREVSSGVKIVDLTGYTDVNKTKIEFLAISVMPRAGSYDIDLNETHVYIELDNLTVLSLNYIDNDVIHNIVSSDGIFHTLNHSNLSSTNFGVIAIRDADNSVVNNHGIGKSDLIMIILNLSATFSTTGGVPTGEEFMGRLVPEVGSSGLFMVSVPNTFDHRIVPL